MKPALVSKPPAILRDTEIGQLRFAVLGEKDVRRLHITMEGAASVRRLQCPCDLTPSRNAPPQPSGPRLRISASSESWG